MMRTHMAGALRASDIGTRVACCGWVAHRRDHGGVAFIDLRDAAGIVQVVVDPERPGTEAAARVRNEWVVRVEGEVRARPEGTANPELASGEVEVAADAVTVLNEADALPFPVDDRVEVDEALRLRHRYLDLRRPQMQRNLRLRADVNAALRASMRSQGFVEIETPLLIASTPEGARDFVVPSRLHPGAFYALPQSPQLLKQLLMVAGLDKYFQVARCLRDEDLRADRQFEFSQLDVEMTFAHAPDVQDAVTAAVLAAVEAVRPGEAPSAIPRITWHEAAERYGTDKPDLRFGMDLTELSDVFARTDFRAFAGAESVKGLRVAGGAERSRAQVDGLVERAKELGAPGLVWMRVRDDRDVDSPVAKYLTDAERAGIVAGLAARSGDLLLLAAGERAMVRAVLGQLRCDLGRPPVSEGLRFAWVVDFPLFDGLDDDGRPIPAHHPFTAPHPDDVDLLETDPLAVRSQAYDLVCNGWELGSGSVRIWDPELQQRVFSVLGIEPGEARARFGFLLEAFRYGAPPHAGFAVGIDRLVAILAGEDYIREVIAFPKTQSGLDPLTGAPGPIDARLLRELGLSVLGSPDDRRGRRSPRES